MYNSEEELVRTMDRLIEEPFLRKGLGIKGHEAFLAKWSVEPHLKLYLELINKLRQGAKSSGA